MAPRKEKIEKAKSQDIRTDREYIGEVSERKALQISKRRFNGNYVRNYVETRTLRRL